jgi:hypothetical protein
LSVIFPKGVIWRVPCLTPPFLLVEIERTSKEARTGRGEVHGGDTGECGEHCVWVARVFQGPECDHAIPLSPEFKFSVPHSDQMPVNLSPLPNEPPHQENQ